MKIALYVQLDVKNYNEYIKVFLELCGKCGIIPNIYQFDDENDLMIYLKEEASEDNLGNCIVVCFPGTDFKIVPENYIEASGNTSLCEKDLISRNIIKILETRIKQAQEMLDKLRKK